MAASASSNGDEEIVGINVTPLVDVVLVLLVVLMVTAGYIASVGFPVPLLLAWLAAFFELALALCLLTGAYFTEASLLAAAYVLFLAVAFHGPARWEGDRTEFRFFLLHFTFIAGLLCAALHGPGTALAIRRNLLGRT